MAMIKVTHEVLKNKLLKGDIKFSFEKLDGTKREATGTTNLDRIPLDLRPKEGKPTSGTVYFDVEKNEWRSIASTQEVMIDADSIKGIYGTPLLEDEEIEMMIWIHGNLKDNWKSNLIGLIIAATPNDAAELGMGVFKKLVRVCRAYSENSEYAESLRAKWLKFLND